MATAEGVFPKTGNDPLYASEINSLVGKSFYFNSTSVTSATSGTAYANWPGLSGAFVAYSGVNSSSVAHINISLPFSVSNIQPNVPLPVTVLIDGISGVIPNIFNFQQHPVASNIAPSTWAGSISPGSHTICVQYKVGASAGIGGYPTSSINSNSNMTIRTNAGEM